MHGVAFLQPFNMMPFLRCVFGAPQSATLVPPKFTSGGYYSMLNSIDVIPFRDPNWGLVDPSGGRAFLQSLLRWVFGAPQSAALVPPKFTSGGYYPLLNSISVRSSVTSVRGGWVIAI